MAIGEKTKPEFNPIRFYKVYAKLFNLTSKSITLMKSSFSIYFAISDKWKKCEMNFDNIF